MDESVQKHIEESLPKVGRFQHFADAMLRGCQIRPIQARGDYFVGEDGACALGAMFVGLGLPACQDVQQLFVARYLRDEALANPATAYRYGYGRTIYEDNDCGEFTREQIAARIAAL